MKGTNDLIMTARHSVAISGQVTDAISGKVIAGAEVEITRSPRAYQKWLEVRGNEFGESWKTMRNRPDITQSRPDGLFYFLDLPEGEYEVTISAPYVPLARSSANFGRRYGPQTKTVKVARDAKKNYVLDWVLVSLSPTAVQGSLKSGNTSISFAQVQIQPGGKSTWTDQAGQFEFTGIEPGEYTLLINARGFKPDSIKQVTIRGPGDVQKLKSKSLQKVD